MVSILALRVCLGVVCVDFRVEAVVAWGWSEVVKSAIWTRAALDLLQPRSETARMRVVNA